MPNFGHAGHGIRLVPGMVIAIEPMINAGAFAVKVLGNDWTGGDPGRFALGPL